MKLTHPLWFTCTRLPRAPRRLAPTTPPNPAPTVCPAHSRLASRLCSSCALSADWVLETDDTLELRTKPNAASLAAGRREYPGGRSPDLGRLDLAAFELDAFFKSAKMNPKQNKNILSSQQVREHMDCEYCHKQTTINLAGADSEHSQGYLYKKGSLLGTRFFRKLSSKRRRGWGQMRQEQTTNFTQWP